MSAIAGNVVDQAETFARNLSQRPVADISDAVTNLPNTISTETNLVTIFNSLLSKVGILVKVGDEVAKVCPALLSSLSHGPKLVADPSLCQFCMASTLRRTEGVSGSIIPVRLVHGSSCNRWFKRNTVETSRSWVLSR